MAGDQRRTSGSDERARRLQQFERDLLAETVERMPPDVVLQGWRDRLPDLVEQIDSDRGEWAQQARALADAIRLRHRSFGVSAQARALLDAMRDTADVVCSEWIVSGVPANVRSAIEAVVTHCSAILTEHPVDWRAAEEGLRAAAATLDPSLSCILITDDPAPAQPFLIVEERAPAAPAVADLRVSMHEAIRGAPEHDLPPTARSTLYDWMRSTATAAVLGINCKATPSSQRPLVAGLLELHRRKKQPKALGARTRTRGERTEAPGDFPDAPRIPPDAPDAPVTDDERLRNGGA